MLKMDLIIVQDGKMKFRELNLPSIRTINLQPALFLAWSYTLYRIIFGPSLNSVPGSGPTRITLQRDDDGKPWEFCSIWSREILMTYSRNLSAVSDTTGGSQFTTAVSFPGSAGFSLDEGHLILGGSISEVNRWRGRVRKESCFRGNPSPEIRRGRNNGERL